MIGFFRWATAFKLNHWPWFALAACALMLGAAHAFETFGHMAPCALCLKQREAYWITSVVALVGVICECTPWRKITHRPICAALVAAFGFGLYYAIWHLGAEHKWWEGMPECAAARNVELSVDSIAKALDGKIDMPSCEDPTPLLGLTMATWNAIILVALIIGSAWAATRDKRP